MYIIVLISIFMLVITFLLDFNGSKYFSSWDSKRNLILFMLLSVLVLIVQLVITILFGKSIFFIFNILNCVLSIWNMYKAMKIYKKYK